MKVIVPKRRQEQQAIEILIQALCTERSLELEIVKDGIDDFPDFTLRNRVTGEEIWVEVVQAVESAKLIAAEHYVQRLYEAASRGYRARGEEVVLTVSPSGVESATPSPGYGVTGVLIPGPARRISPSDWIAKALEQKGRPDRYGPIERARTTLLIDCSEEVLVGKEDTLQIHDDLQGNAVGFREIWCASANWQTPKAVLLAP